MSPLEKVVRKSNHGGRRPGSGRKRGVPNRVTTDVRAAIAAFASANVEKLGAWLEAVPEERRMDVFLRLLEFHVPKISRAEVTGAAGGAVEHTYRWLGDDET
jgi:hypothetical protein